MHRKNHPGSGSFILLLSLLLCSVALVFAGALSQVRPTLAALPLETTSNPRAYLPVMLRPAATNTPAPTATSVPSTPTVTSGPGTPTATLPPPDGAIIVDHTSIALFDQIPDQYLAAARGLRVLFSDRSVGQNINEGLNCLTASSWLQAPASCRRDYTGVQGSQWLWKTFGAADYPNNVPARILFDPDPVRYNRSNWAFEFRTGTWQELTADFVQNLVPSYVTTREVLSYQFSYLNVDAGSDIAHPTTGFFAPSGPERWSITDIEALQAQYPTKYFIFWTTSLARPIGTQPSEDFNHQMRQYVLANDQILIDVAAILSHNEQGQPCYDNRDGVAYSNGNESENYPNDNINRLAICQDYTTEIDGGHLGSVSAGKIRIAKAFWVLMAQIAGWHP